MMNLLFLSSTILSLVAPARQTPVQPGGLKTEIALAALSYADTTILHGARFALDAERPAHAMFLAKHPDGMRQTVHDQSFLSAAASMGRLRVARRSDVLRCASKLPSSCELIDTDALLSISEAVGTTEQVTLTVDHYFKTKSQRQPIARETFELTLVASRAGVWRVTQKRLVSQT